VHRDVRTRILDCASRGMLRRPFLSDVARLIREWCRCDAVEVRVVERQKLWRAESSEDIDPPRCDVLAGRCSQSGRILPCVDVDTELENLCQNIIEHRIDLSLPWFTVDGTFWTGNIQETFESNPTGSQAGRSLADGSFRSLVIIPYELDDCDAGLVLLKSRQQNHFLPDEIGSHERMATILGVAARQRRSQIALRERVKELTCLHGITRIAARPEVTLEQILKAAADLIPKACLHEDLASAKIIFDDLSFSSEIYLEGTDTHTQEIVVDGRRRGEIILGYDGADLPELDKGPFIKEELDLLEVVAKELAIVIDARETEAKRDSLENQLRHADRLATIGQLAAGVAHELNEPLASILGRAELSRKMPGLPDQARSDYDKIIAASLHAREVISKLKLFARRTPVRKEASDLNEVVRDGLAMLKEHLESAGIQLETRLDPELPKFVADSSQMHQVLINLVVNALQATPPEGRIVVQTFSGEAEVVLVVEDTGTGMSDETLKQIFTPFFTTKDVDQGTGLGLAVVHGIVSSHGGTIHVKSKLGEGSRFELRLPCMPHEQGDRGGASEDAKG